MAPLSRDGWRRGGCRMLQRVALLVFCAAPCFSPAGAVSGYGSSLAPKMTLVQKRRQEKEAELIRAFGGDLGSCQKKHESSMQREQREALLEQQAEESVRQAERQAEESVREAERLLEEDTRVREEETRRGTKPGTRSTSAARGASPPPTWQQPMHDASPWQQPMHDAGRRESLHTLLAESPRPDVTPHPPPPAAAAVAPTLDPPRPGSPPAGAEEVRNEVREEEKKNRRERRRNKRKKKKLDRSPGTPWPRAARSGSTQESRSPEKRVSRIE
ncbi:hypothetical protein T484DRAFT_1964832 [Baffinella frigidus]|nr:hypothetical protein T484DRAFT_1964832 [Cryptophyta sp. CCMP2293]